MRAYNELNIQIYSENLYFDLNFFLTLTWSEIIKWFVLEYSIWKFIRFLEEKNKEILWQDITSKCIDKII